MATHDYSIANAAGAISVTNFGAQPSIPNRQDIDRIVKDEIC